MVLIRNVVVLAALFSCTASYGNEELTDGVISACIAEQSMTVSDDKTIGELKRECDKSIDNPFAKRLILERHASKNPFAILPYKPNYILPFTYSKAIEDPYIDSLNGHSLDDVEAKFQVSLKYIVDERFLIKYLSLATAFTTTSWWQSYNSDISAAFRETNYEPELIFTYSKPWRVLGIDINDTSLSLNHQSNGQSGLLSRSWNRVIFGISGTNNNNIMWNLRTWWRLPESDKVTPEASDGDDNPNIENYMGYGELGLLWKVNHTHNLDMIFRNNLKSDNRTTIQLGWSFPLGHNLRGYVEYFNGYGESLIYYNRHASRLGIGVKLTDWL